MEGFVISWVRKAQNKRKKDVLDDYEDETTFEKMLRLENEVTDNELQSVVSIAGTAFPIQKKSSS